MYKIYCDGTLICDSRIEELAVISPEGRVEVNRAGTFRFTLPPTHPYYDLVANRKSIIDVYRGDAEEPLFEGICVAVTDDFYKQRTVECEGDLTFLNDSIQRQARYQGMTVRGLLEAYITAHNNQVEDKKKFEVGIVTVNDSENLFRYTNYQSTLAEIAEDLIENYGGYIRIRHQGGKRYIDYLAESPHTCDQVIKLGKNLLDFSRNFDSVDLATSIIPLGAVIEQEVDEDGNEITHSAVEGLDERVTITSVNAGKDYLYSEEAVNNYGWITKAVTWDDVNSPSILKQKGEKYLAETQFEKMVLEVKALDLNMDNAEIEAFRVLDKIRTVSKPHGLDNYFVLSKLEFKLNNPEDDIITLGESKKVTMSAANQSANAEIMRKIEEVEPSKIVAQAVANASQLITNAMGGYVYKTQNELYIMDTNNPETATKVWRWNVNGLGYSKNGVNGSYELAMTMDGSIVADRVTTGTMSADRIYGGTLELGRTANEAGELNVYSSSGAKIMSVNKNGFYLNGNYFEVHTDNFDCSDDGLSISGDINADNLLYHNHISMVYGDDYVESDKCQVIGLKYSDSGAGSSYYNLVIGQDSLKPIGTGRRITDTTEIAGNLKVNGYIENNGFKSLGSGWYRKRLSVNQYEYIYQGSIGSGSFSSYGNWYYMAKTLSFPESISSILEYNANVFSSTGLYSISMYGYSSDSANFYISSAKAETANLAINFRMIATK